MTVRDDDTARPQLSEVTWTAKNPVDNADPNGNNVATKKKEDGDDAMLVLTMAMKTMLQLLMLTLWMVRCERAC